MTQHPRPCSSFLEEGGRVASLQAGRQESPSETHALTHEQAARRVPNPLTSGAQSPTHPHRRSAETHRRPQHIINVDTHREGGHDDHDALVVHESLGAAGDLGNVDRVLGAQVTRSVSELGGVTAGEAAAAYDTR